MSQFDLLQEGSFYDSTVFHKYKISSTGLTITLLHHDGPIISGSIVLRTLTDDNVGLPHALEHLVFMGSSSYPKGFLDFAANQCYSNGTNAWTDQDHTAYTVQCAGKEGFFTFLPIFLDHILNPKLTCEAYVTEGHHINGDGKDGGVVYCEMQSYENTMECIAERAFASNMFGLGSPYAVETGGLLNDIRKSCNIEKCRSFHNDAYQMQNMNIVICGNVTINEVFNAINILPVKNDVYHLSENNSSDSKTFEMADCIFNPVFQFETVSFPSPDNRDPGCVLIGFKSYSLDKPLEILAENLLIDYLINTPASPLSKDLVHIATPYCSHISYSRYMYSKTAVQLKFHESNPEHHHNLKDLVVKILRKVANSGMDIERMKLLAENKMLKEKFEIENNNLEKLASFSYSDFIYETKFSNLLGQYACIEDYYYQLINSSQAFWFTLLNKLTDNLLVCIVAQPSLELLGKLELQEKERVNRQIQELGNESIREFGKALYNAEQVNNIKYSPEIYNQINKTNFDSFNIHDRAEMCTTLNVYPNIYLHEVKSSFYRIYIIIDTAGFSAEQKSTVPLFLETCCKLPIIDVSSGLSMTGDEVADEFERIFVDYTISLGLYGEQICMDFIVQEENLEKSIEMLHQILFNQYIDKKRVEEYQKNLIASVKADKRCGYENIQALRFQLLFPDSVSAKSTLFEQEKFLESVSLDDLCSNLQCILHSLFTGDCCIHIISKTKFIQNIDIEKLSICLKLDSKGYKSNFVKLKSFLPKNKNFSKTENTIVKVPGEETSYMVSVIPVSHSFYGTLDISMRIFHAWFGQLDGLVGREIRGKGLAYHYFSKSSAFDGILEFQLQQSTDIMTAFSATKDFIEKMLSSENRKDYLDEKHLELAKCEFFYSLMECISSPCKSALWDIKLMHSDETSPKSLSSIVENLNKVSCQDVFDLCRMYHLRLFQKGESFKIYTVPPNCYV